MRGQPGPLLDAVDDALGRLGAARGSLASTGGLAATVRAGHEARQALADLRTAGREEIPIDLTDPEAFETLRDLGTAGGRLLRLEGDTAIRRASCLNGLSSFNWAIRRVKCHYRVITLAKLIIDNITSSRPRNIGHV